MGVCVCHLCLQLPFCGIHLQVHKVFPLGAAAQEGSIRAGDQVLSINGTTLCGSGHWEATRTLRKAKSRGMGVVVLRRRGVLASSEEGDGMDEMDSAQTQSRDTGKGPSSASDHK